MKLLIDGQNIILEIESEKLKSYQRFQLEYYGFFQEREGDRFVKLSHDILVDVSKLNEFFAQEGIQIYLTKHASSFLDKYRNQKQKQEKLFNLAKDFKEGRIHKKSYANFNNFLESLPRKLKTHQKKAAYHHYILKNAANFSTPGSGKTSVMLAVFEKLKRDQVANVLFVVGPPSCFDPWIYEFKQTLGRKPKFKILSGLNRETRKEFYNSTLENICELYLVSYHTISNDLLDIKLFFQRQGISVVLVVDEAHYIKQIGGTWSDTLLQLANLVDHRFILTGTPIPKSYKDVFNLFEFLWPMNAPISSEEKIKISVLEEAGRNEEVRDFLLPKIGPLFYRVRKNDLGLKEPLFHPPIKVEMNPIEQRIYSIIISKIHELSSKDIVENQELISGLWRGRMMRLRQAISYPKLLSNSIENYSETLIEGDLRKKIIDYDKYEIPAKLEALTLLCQKLLAEREKVVIWSNFIGTLKLIKEHFAGKRIVSEIIYGNTPVVTRKDIPSEIKAELTRQEIIDVFLDRTSEVNILIANPAACAESISLHKSCKQAIYYDLSYNCAQYLQSLDRIHRIGGSELAISNYYFLQYKHSIDEKIKRNLDQKARKMSEIIDKEFSVYSLDMFDGSDEVELYKSLFHK